MTSTMTWKTSLQGFTRHLHVFVNKITIFSLRHNNFVILYVFNPNLRTKLTTQNCPHMFTTTTTTHGETTTKTQKAWLIFLEELFLEIIVFFYKEGPNIVSSYKNGKLLSFVFVAPVFLIQFLSWREDRRISNENYVTNNKQYLKARRVINCNI